MRIFIVNYRSNESFIVCKEKLEYNDGVNRYKNLSIGSSIASILTYDSFETNFQVTLSSIQSVISPMSYKIYMKVSFIQQVNIFYFNVYEKTSSLIDL